MADVKPNGNPRDAIHAARARRLQLIQSKLPSPTIKVFAANEDMREFLRHPSGGRFRDTLDQGVDWPNDSFTARRIAEGAVRTDGPGAAEPATVDESLNVREQAEALRPKSAEQPKPEAKAAKPSQPTVI